MFIDTHMHEMTYSKDSFLALDQMVQIARMKGLEGICVTDHDSMGLKEYAAEYSKDTGFPIFVGIEYYSLQGDIVAFGIEDYPTERIPAQDFIDLVNAQGGVCALELGLFTLGSSDCHVPEKVGVCATYFPERFHTMEGFLDAFRKGQMKPAYYAGGKYHVLELKEQQKSKIPFTFYAFNDRMYL